MARYTYERLSAQDNSFLLLESSNVHMHVAATTVFGASPLKTADGGIDIEAIKRATEAVLHLIPRYCQKLKWIPFESHAVWIDDRHFNLDYHIRHTSLPRPGTDEQLKLLAGRVMAQQLDRSRPLWEIWVVEGLERDRFAMINKMHHCMIDGASGVDLSQILMSQTAEHPLQEVRAFVPRPAPSRVDLWRDEFARRLSLPLQAARSFREFTRQTDDLRLEIRTRIRAVAALIGWAVRGASPTPINGRLGPHRKFDWITMPLEEVKAVRKALGCTVNDVVLTTVAGAVREYMIHRRVNPAELDFRVSAPVSVRREEEQGTLGNRVSSWIIRLPLKEADPRAQLDAIHELTRNLKESKQALGVEMMMAAAEWTPPALLSLGAQAASGPINMIVTNVPGPQIPLYMLGAKLEACFPQVPLLENTGLGIALFSYDGKLCWGFNADYNLVPDLPVFIRAIENSFAALSESAGLRGLPPESGAFAPEV